MSRGIGRQQRRILDLLAAQAQPMTELEITAALGHRDRNLPRTLATLKRRGRISVQRGRWRALPPPPPDWWETLPTFGS